MLVHDTLADGNGRLQKDKLMKDALVGVDSRRRKDTLVHNTLPGGNGRLNRSS